MARNAGPANKGLLKLAFRHPSSPDIDKRDAYETKKLPNGSLLKKASESISRVLSLGRPFISNACHHASQARNPSARKGTVSRSYLRLLQMGFTKLRCCQRTGALLPHRFSFSPACRGVFFSVALSVGSPRPAVSWHLALWSPDFPHAAQGGARSSGPLTVWYSTISEPKQGAS